MSKISAKTSSNVFYQARMEASEHNDKLTSRDGATEEMAMDRGRLFRIESGVADPHPDEVLMMSRLYDKPYLENYYCTRCCPLGKNVPVAKETNLDRITIELLATIRKLDGIKGELVDITADGVIEECEKDALADIVKKICEVETVAESLKLWARKNLKEV